MTLRIRAAAAILLATSIAGAAFAQDHGADIFKAKCANCHGTDGLATTPAAKSMRIRSFKAPDLVKCSDTQFIDFVTKAYKGYGMTDAQVRDVVAYIRKLQK